MPISREEFEGASIDWGQRILQILNRDRTQAYTEREILEQLAPTPARGQLRRTLDTLIAAGLVLRRRLRRQNYYIHAARGRHD